jgi:hypothetical protein
MSDHEQQVRERAHRLWEEAGRPEGRDAEFWERAEREIAGEGGQPDRPEP